MKNQAHVVVVLLFNTEFDDVFLFSLIPYHILLRVSLPVGLLLIFPFFWNLEIRQKFRWCSVVFVRTSSLCPHHHLLREEETKASSSSFEKEPRRFVCVVFVLSRTGPTNNATKTLLSRTLKSALRPRHHRLESSSENHHHHHG